MTTTMTTTWTRGLTLMALLAFGTACDQSPRLETRTFELQHLEPGEAMSLVDPYIYGDREGAPGAMSAIQTAITIRETPDNLDQIQRVISEFDVARSDVRLRFQVIEADGFTDADPSIAEVEDELRKLFPFEGYRLAGEAVVSATDRSDIGQVISGNGSVFELSAEVYWAQPGTIRLQDVSINSSMGGGIRTTVNIRPGQTLVLGSSSLEGSTSTLFFTVQAESVDGPGE